LQTGIFAESGSRGRSLAQRLPALGVDYGQTADNLPPPSAVAKLVQSTSISKLRLYGADPAILQAFANTGIGLVVGIGNDQIPSLNQLAVAQNWIKNNIVPFVPATDIIGISVGNEVLFSGDGTLISQLLPALQNLHTALVEVSLDQQIKVSTPHSMAILSTSAPPSAGRFNESFDMKSLLDFLQKIGAPLMINPYPYFAYKSNPTDHILVYALFEPNPGFYDTNSGLTYTNMFDAQLDAVYSAMKYLGYPGVDIVVAETGWPSVGDPTETGVSLQNAIAYNGNLIKHVTSMTGTPLRPNRYIQTYIFALFNEDLKPGPTSEHNYGLFKVDMTMAYDVGLLQSPVSKLLHIFQFFFQIVQLVLTESSTLTRVGSERPYWVSLDRSFFLRLNSLTLDALRIYPLFLIESVNKAECSSIPSCSTHWGACDSSSYRESLVHCQAGRRRANFGGKFELCLWTGN